MTGLGDGPAADLKRIAESLCLLAIMESVAAIAARDLVYVVSLVQSGDADRLVGWDLLATCHGLAALTVGKDPYIHSNLAYVPSSASWMSY